MRKTLTFAAIGLLLLTGCDSPTTVETPPAAEITTATAADPAALAAIQVPDQLIAEVRDPATLGCVAPPTATLEAASRLAQPPSKMAAFYGGGTGWGAYYVVAAQTNDQIEVTIVPWNGTGPEVNGTTPEPVWPIEPLDEWLNGQHDQNCSPSDPATWQRAADTAIACLADL
jgi:hypothetical protein